MLFGALGDLKEIIKKANMKKTNKEENIDPVDKFRTCMTGSSACDDLLKKFKDLNSKDEPSSMSGKEFRKHVANLYGKNDDLPSGGDWENYANGIADEFWNCKDINLKAIINTCISHFNEIKNNKDNKDNKDDEKSPRNIFSDITFNIIDSDKSGIIGLKEYRNYVKGLSGNLYSSNRADTEFKTFDADNSNAIDVQEFRYIFKIAIYGFKDANPEFIFKQIDSNEDGKIVYEEFMSYFRKNYPECKKSQIEADFKWITRDDDGRNINVESRSIGFNQFSEFHENYFATKDEIESEKKEDKKKSDSTDTSTSPSLVTSTTPDNNGNGGGDDDDDDDDGKAEAN